MNLEVYWTRFAENKLDDIYIYFETTASVSVAKKLVNGIIDKTIGIKRNPDIGQRELLLENYTQNFRYLVFKNYKIIYWVNISKHQIEIVNVFDTRQNPDKLSVTTN